MKMSIYSITNIINNKIYIGISKEVKTREHKHFWMLENNRHENRKLQNAYNFYGKEAFIFKIIDEIETDDIMEALDLEHFYIMEYDSYRNGYNKSIGYDGSTSIQFTPERLEKMSRAMKGNQYAKGCKRNEKHKQLISKVHKNKKLSDETKIKISKARKGKYKGEENPFYNKHHTQDTINKIKEKVNKSKILCIETKKVYESISECSRDINIDRSNISKVCRGVSKKAGGYTFKYID